MGYAPLRKYNTIREYREHFERVYCKSPIFTFDGLKVRFRKTMFDHCFFESSNKDKVKDKFSQNRAERIDWIGAVLQDPAAELYVGWDSRRKRYDSNRRVALVAGDYVVIIRLNDKRRVSEFVTAFVADSGTTIPKIRGGPRWK